MKRLICGIAALALIFSACLAEAADLTEHQWVRVAEGGTVKGRVIVPRAGGITAARDAKINLIDKDGKTVVKNLTSDKTGRFSMTGVEPGVYTLLVQGDDTFACCALHVVRSNVPISDSFKIAAGAMDPSVVRNAMLRYLRSGQVAKVDFDPSQNPLTSERAHIGELVRVSQVEGGLKGRLTRAGFSEDLGAGNANILVFQDGVQVARTVTDAKGNFTIKDLAPGSYSILGSGKAGFGLMGLEVVDPLAAAALADRDAGDETFVVQDSGPSTTFVMQVAPGPVTIVSDTLISEEEIGPVPFDDYGGGVAGGGGGGGGGGLGGLGGIGLGAAGLAVALANDNNNNFTTPPPASPTTP